MVKRITLSSSLVKSCYGEKTKEKQVEANVVFGQTSRGCKGNGICRVDMLRPKSKFQPFSAKRENEDICTWHKSTFFCSAFGQVGLRIRTEDLGRVQIEKHFKNLFFEVAEDFDLPEWLCKALNKETYKIQTGYYWIEKRGDCLEVCF